MATEGYDLIGVDLEPEGLAESLELVAALGGLAEGHALDICDAAAFDGLAAALSQKGRSVNVLINNAGIGVVGSILDTEPSVWNRIMEVNLTAMFTTCRALLPTMLRNGGGTVVNVASVSGAFVGQAQRAAYCASKAGVVGLTRSVAADFADQGIRANAVCPGPVATPWGPKLAATARDPEAALAAMRNRSMGEASDIAAAITFLAGPESRYMNGAAMVVDGGATAFWASGA
jgi:NAD(P)-dependent dehydrogenase (short-subunit alcohol dehydrogenase family)